MMGRVRVGEFATQARRERLMPEPGLCQRHLTAQSCLQQRLAELGDTAQVLQCLGQSQVARRALLDGLAQLGLAGGRGLGEPGGWLPVLLDMLAVGAPQQSADVVGVQVPGPARQAAQDLFLVVGRFAVVHGRIPKVGAAIQGQLAAPGAVHDCCCHQGNG
ncbi:hypothetical protein WR25_25869 [Diploscapter pachys]|uniref:Uncharacterized protein n=1 Tax=Diploscapter pachys TaxID=2018661 RepID=A0A2A2KAL0_9BILA|nr:hypothetical protein WR25_25869 [Diploscapter pachys]